jgi:hypothetical protein
VKDFQISTALVLERLGREELRLKQQGLAAHAQGARALIVAFLKLVDEGQPIPDPIDPSDP